MVTSHCRPCIVVRMAYEWGPRLNYASLREKDARCSIR